MVIEGDEVTYISCPASGNAINNCRQTGARDDQQQTVSRMQTATSRQTGNRNYRTQVWRRLMYEHSQLELDAFRRTRVANEDKSKRRSDDQCKANKKYAGQLRLAQFEFDAYSCPPEVLIARPSRDRPQLS